jgi:apolipoprotein N-acyltransferase
VAALPEGELALDPREEAPLLPVRAPSFPQWARGIETLLPFALIWGLYHLPPARPPVSASASRPLRVAMVQRNFPCVFKESAEDPLAVYEKLYANVAPLDPQLVVLPESALCEIGRIGTASAARFASWTCEKTGARALLAGGSRRAGGREYNSAALYEGENPPRVYDKVHLVPFGEFIPGDKWIAALQKFAPVGSCTPGELKLLEVDGIRLGVAICFEDTDSAQIRRLAAMGAQALVFVTNDSWFSRSVETVQHAWQAVARAIETGLPVVRVGNSGVTGTMTPAGGVSWLIGADGRPLVDRQGTLFDRLTVALHPAPTPYVRWGDWPLAVLFALAVAFAVFCRKRENP